MNAHEICAISDVTEAVLNGWDVCEQKMPAIIEELTWKMQTASDEARMQWDFDSRLAA